MFMCKHLLNVNVINIFFQNKMDSFNTYCFVFFLYIVTWRNSETRENWIQRVRFKEVVNKDFKLSLILLHKRDHYKNIL